MLSENEALRAQLSRLNDASDDKICDKPMQLLLQQLNERFKRNVLELRTTESELSAIQQELTSLLNTT